MDLDNLHAFAVFAEERNFTRAAGRLHISQPALHVKINKLGDDFGVRLYARRGRGLVLTTDGERVLGFARESLERRDRFMACLRGAEQIETLTIAAGEGTLLFLVDEALQRFRARASAPRVRLLVRDAAGTVAAVRTGEAHLGLCPAFAPVEDLDFEPLVEVGMQAVIPRSHPLASRKRLALGLLDGAPLVLPPRGSVHRTTVEGALLAHGARCDVAVEASGWSLMLRFAALGLGIAITNDHCPAPEGCIALPIPQLARFSYGALTRRGARSAAVNTFLGLARRRTGSPRRR